MLIQSDLPAAPSGAGCPAPLLRAAAVLGDRVAGWERSVKWRLDGGGQDDQRWVFGFRTDGMGEAAFLSILDELGPPADAIPPLRAMWPAAHFAYLGAESGGYKVYLEFPVRLTGSDSRGRGVWAPAGLWARAFKWLIAPRSVGPPWRQTEYWLVPGATLLSSMVRIAEGEPDHPILEPLSAIARLRPLAAEKVDTLTLYEVRHADGGRAWDVNLYGFHLQIEDELVSALGAWPAPLQARGAPLGHLAAGRDREGRAYRSAYWPISPPL